MSAKQTDLDVNEVFESLLFAEENAINKGYTEGYETGKKQLLDGYHLGYHRASLLAAQLGYYSGILQQYLSSNQSESQKSVLLARDVLQSIQNFPKRNNENVDILNALDNIKIKYAKFCSLARISPLYPEADKLNF